MQLQANNTSDLDADKNIFHKIRIESLGLSTRIANTLISAGIRTIGGILRKDDLALLDIRGLGLSGLEEIKSKINDPTTLLLKENIEESSKPFKKESFMFKSKEEENEFYKTRIESLDFSTRTKNALINASVRTVGGIMRKTETSLLEIPGLGLKGMGEIKDKLNYPTQIINEKEYDKPIAMAPQYPETDKNQSEIELDEPTPYKFDGDSRKIIKFFANYFKVDEAIIRSQTRKKEVVGIRDSIIYFLREYCGMSYPDIGRLFHKDHTTMIHSYRKIKDNVVNVENFSSQFSVLINELKSSKEIITNVENKPADKVNPGVFFKKLELKFKDISDRDMKVLNLYREGLTLEEVSKSIGVTRERVRQIVDRTIRQMADNDSVSRGIIVDQDVVLEEEKKKRNLVQKKLSEVPIKSIKEKRWSRYYLACRSCGTTSIPHIRKGLCEQCLGGFRENRREEIINQHQNKCDLCGILRHEAISLYGRDFYITKDKKVFCRKCFLEKTGTSLGSYKNYSWSRFYPACKSCGTTTIPHSKRGFCRNCDPQITNERREQRISRAGSHCMDCGIDRREAKTNYGKDLFVTKSGNILCQMCFQRYAKNTLKKATSNKTKV